MPFTNSSNAQIFYTTFGKPSNPALIFSNSLGTDYTMWEKQINFLKDKYYIICYDKRGHGQSSTPPGPYTIKELAGDAIQVLDALQIEKAFFCGISIGGLTAQYVAINYPERFNAVVASNTAAKIGEAKAWYERAQSVRDEGLKGLSESAPQRWFTEHFIQSSPQEVNALCEVMAKGDPEGYASCCEALATADLREDIKNISIPMLIISGTQDPATTVEHGQIMHDSIPNSNLVILEASHIPNIELSEKYNEVLETFLNEHLS